MRALSTIMKRSRQKAAPAMRPWKRGSNSPLLPPPMLQSRAEEKRNYLWSVFVLYWPPSSVFLVNLCVVFPLHLDISWGHLSDPSELGCRCHLWFSPRQIAILWSLFFVRISRTSELWSWFACFLSHQQCPFVVETGWCRYTACGYTVTCHAESCSLHHQRTHKQSRNANQHQNEFTHSNLNDERP